MMSKPTARQLACVACVAAAMLPLGEMLYPLVEDLLTTLQFDVVEAFASAGLGVVIHAAMFG